MTHVSIIGKGNMGPVISGIVTNGGNTVEVFDTADTDKAVTGDIVVLAVPYPAVASVLAQRADQLAGKVVVDITNPLNFETFDSLTVPADGSGRRRDRRGAAAVARAQGVQHQLRGHPGGRHRRRRTRPPCSSPATTRTPKRCWPASSPPAAYTPSTRAH